MKITPENPSESNAKRITIILADPNTKHTVKKPCCVGDDPPDNGQVIDWCDQPLTMTEGIQISDQPVNESNCPIPESIINATTLVSASSPTKIPSWEIKLWLISEEEILDEDLKIIEGDVVHSTVDGIIAIKRIQNLAAKSFDPTVVDMCPSVLNPLGKMNCEPVVPSVPITPTPDSTLFGPWMMVEHRRQPVR
ncbi:hypothetical protein V6N12_028349 [Hibiscus sabdariffa]|uniref:Uncharacterized protein n=1 Tax=Hibiscus sabdariffa TaxID=183260 RepID=A0ABR2F5K2_9ROSI